MKTCLEKLSHANRWRIRHGKSASQDSDGFNGNFIVPMDGELWFVSLCDKTQWRTLMVSGAHYAGLPSWTTILALRNSFFPDDEYAAIFLGPRTRPDCITLMPYE